MKSLIVAALVLIAVIPAKAAEMSSCKDTPTLLNEVALNGAAGTRTFTVYGVSGFGTLSLASKFTHANNGTLTFTCTGSSGKGGPAQITAFATTLSTCTVASGTCTLSWAGTVVTPTLTASKNFAFPLGVQGETNITCVVAHGGVPNANDKLTVVGRLCSN